MADSNADVPGALSRREFLKVGAAGALSTGLPATLLGQPAAPAAPGTDATEVVGPGPVPIRLQVNGKAHALTVEPRVTLLRALRDHLDLTGAKEVCDRGTCGACTVVVGGKAVQSCSLLAIDAEGAEILTVEGLGTPQAMSPLQAAFVANDAQQCGACTPGFVMACHAFLESHADPTADDVLHGLGGNLCRCGTYDGIKRAVMQAAAARKGAARG